MNKSELHRWRRHHRCNSRNALIASYELAIHVQRHPMNIEEALEKIEGMSDRDALVAKPPLSWGAEAMIIQLTDSYSVPQSVKDAGFEYLLEREELEDLLRSIGKKKVSTRTRAEFIIYYAIMDSYPA